MHTEKKKTKGYMALGVIASVMMIFICLITGFEAAAYGDYVSMKKNTKNIR